MTDQTDSKDLANALLIWGARAVTALDYGAVSKRKCARL